MHLTLYFQTLKLWKEYDKKFCYLQIHQEAFHQFLWASTKSKYGIKRVFEDGYEEKIG